MDKMDRMDYMDKSPTCPIYPAHLTKEDIYDTHTWQLYA